MATNDHEVVGMVECDRSDRNQQWSLHLYNIRHVASSLCLHYEKRRLIVEPCEDDVYNQMWMFDNKFPN